MNTTPVVDHGAGLLKCQEYSSPDRRTALVN
jgi:hypothetical protein